MTADRMYKFSQNIDRVPEQLEVIAVDRYEDAPAMQVAHEAHVIQMSDPASLRALVDRIKPDIIIPGSEHIAAETLIELEEEGNFTKDSGFFAPSL